MPRKSAEISRIDSSRKVWRNEITIDHTRKERTSCRWGGWKERHEEEEEKKAGALLKTWAYGAKMSHKGEIQRRERSLPCASACLPTLIPLCATRVRHCASRAALLSPSNARTRWGVRTTSLFWAIWGRRQVDRLREQHEAWFCDYRCLFFF